MEIGFYLKIDSFTKKVFQLQSKNVFSKHFLSGSVRNKNNIIISNFEKSGSVAPVILLIKLVSPNHYNNDSIIKYETSYRRNIIFRVNPP